MIRIDKLKKKVFPSFGFSKKKNSNIYNNIKFIPSHKFIKNKNRDQ